MLFNSSLKMPVRDPAFFSTLFVVTRVSYFRFLLAAIRQFSDTVINVIGVLKNSS